MKKVIGIICEKIKLELFEKKLNEKGFEYKVKRSVKGMKKSQVKLLIYFDRSSRMTLAKLCSEVQIETNENYLKNNA